MHNIRILSLVLGFFWASSLFSQQLTPRQGGDKLAALLSYIEMAYVDSTDLDALTEQAIIGVLETLDPHSSYISSEELQEMNEELSGNFEGIGVQFQVFKDTIRVIAAISGGPSEKAGIRAGDKIVQIDGNDATGKKVDNKYVMDRLRGKQGTQVVIGIMRNGLQAVKNYTIIRDKIPITSLDAAFMVNQEIGYIKLNRFAQNTIREYHDALSALKDKGMKRLILDLRSNAGGYLYAAVELADDYLGSVKLIVYTEGMRSPRQEMKSTWLGRFEKGDLVILIDEGSASASEIVAGAVQDWDRGIIVGRRSFGKGLVHKQYPLTDGSAIRLTTARYFTPSGRSIQKPYENGLEDYYEDFSRRFEHGELVNPDSIHFPDSLRYFTNGGRLVYGGGGIMPDVFVPWDSAAYTDYFADLVRQGIINEWVLQYVEANRPLLLEKYPQEEAYLKGFEVLPAMQQALLKLAEERGLERSASEWDASAKVVVAQIKALIAQNLYGTDAFFYVIMQDDPAFLRSLEILADKELQRNLLNRK